MNRQFYYNSDLNKETQIELFKKAWEMSDSKWFDELDCSKSWLRKKIEMPLDDFIKRLDASDFIQWRYCSNNDIFTGDEVFEFFVRFDEWWNEPKEDETGKYLLRRNRDLFGWVQLPIMQAEPLITEYKLEQVK